MAKYLFVYRMTPGSQAPSPEEMQKSLAQWGVWMEQFKKNILDLGDGLKPEGRVLAQNGSVVNGPFVEAKDVVGGYSIIQAASFDEALTVARACPASKGGSIEIRELAGFGS